MFKIKKLAITVTYLCQLQKKAMDYFYPIIDKIIIILLLMGTGVLAKRLRLISDQGEKDISNLMMDIFWPAMIFHSITTTLTAEDIVLNIWLPISSFGIHLAGYLVGLAICRLAGHQGDRRKIFLFFASLNNFFLMALPFAQLFLPKRGTALLAVANLGSIITLWTLGVFIIIGNPGYKKTIRNVCSPGLLATVGGVLFVFTGANNFVPDPVIEILRTLGQPTLIIGMIVAGTQIYKLGMKALKFDAWNLQVGLIRNILMPGLMLIAALLLRDHMTPEALVIFVLVAATPGSVNSVTLAMKYNSSASLAAEGVVFTHLLAVFTVPGYIALADTLLDLSRT